MREDQRQEKRGQHSLVDSTSVCENAKSSGHSLVVDDPLDRTVTLKVLDSNTSQRAIDLHTVDQGALADHLEGGDLLEDLVVGGAVEDDGVDGLESADARFWM